MKTMFWHFARLVAVVGVVVVIRVGLGWFALNQVESSLGQLEHTMEAIDQGVPIDPVAIADGPAGEGDDGRADAPIHTDLQREGQVVVRDGKRVVLVDASDPDNEVWIELGDAAQRQIPWILRDGWGPTVGAIAAGCGTYVVGWALLMAAFGGREERSA